MAPKIVMISGPIGAGKTTLCKHAEREYGFLHFKTNIPLRELYLRETNGAEVSRGALQDFGENLDRRTKGGWVCKALQETVLNSPANATILVDAVRIESQITCVRQAYGSVVTHVHLSTPTEELVKRYKARVRTDLREFKRFEEAQVNETEKQVATLESKADILIDTKRCTERDVLVRLIAHLGLLGCENRRLVDVLVGGQYGSEGKGNIAAYLAPEYDVLVRVGGPNAGHKVFQEPKPDTFHMLPSGTRRAPHSKVIIGPGAVLNVEKLLDEISMCDLDKARLVIDSQAMLISKKDISSETKLTKAIGSTGQGVGYATARRITGRVPDKTKLAKDSPDLKPYIGDAWVELQAAFRREQKVLLEGTQGTGLSLFHGDYPHVTSRDTTVSGCLAEAGISPSRVRKIVMVCRTYPIRVQSPGKGMHSGPMAQEINLTEVHRRSKVALSDLQSTERTSTTNRKRRIGEFEWEQFFKATALNGPTDIALTFADYIDVRNRLARRYEQLTEETIRFIEQLERVSCARTSLISTRFHYRNVIDRRTW